MYILLADDHVMFRSGLRRILADEFPKASIEEASSCDEVMKKIGGKTWNLVVLDIAMGKQNSLHILPDIKRLYPNMPVLLLSMYGDKQFIVQALRGGASGYLTKEHAPEELIRAIHTILAGRRYVSESVAGHLADYLAVGSSEYPHEVLSPREHEVFLLLASGRAVSEIASELCLSVKTVSTHRSRILEKMALGSNAELMRYAMQHGLVK